MNVPLRSDLKQWVEDEVRRGHYPSEEAVVTAALDAFREREVPVTLEDFLDLDFLALCDREGDESITLEEVLEATSNILGSMARAIIEEERADRF